MSADQNISGGTQKFWFNGLPTAAPVGNIGTLKYWFNGLPMQFLNNNRRPGTFSTTYNVGLSVLLDQVN